MVLEGIQIFVGLLGAIGFLALGFGVLILAKKTGASSASAHDDVVVSIKNLNETFENRSDELLQTVLSKAEYKAKEKAHKKRSKAERKDQEKLAKAKGLSENPRNRGTADSRVRENNPQKPLDTRKRVVSREAASLAARRGGTQGRPADEEIEGFRIGPKDETVEGKSGPAKKRVYVLSFTGDVNASQVHGLREAITALVPLLRKEIDEIVLKLESPGGVVHGYGLAAAQVLRLKKAAARVTICVDKVAASGGYMMACLADEIVASPFAIVGSIGAVAGVPNVHRFIKEKNIDYLEMTAGKYKRTLSMLGEVTDEKKQKFQEQLDDVHTIFKDHVKQERPSLDLEKVGTGEYWYGVRALENGLVDRLGTSDEVILSFIETSDVFEVSYKEKESMRDKLTGRFFSAVQKVLGRTISF